MRRLRPESDTLNALREKMPEYLENGARLGGLIDPVLRGFSHADARHLVI